MAPQARRRFLRLTALFLAGPLIWMSHFMAVYVLGEAVCAADVEAQFLGLHVFSSLTLIATMAAGAATIVTTVCAYRRWRSSGVGWNGSQGGGDGVSHDAEQEGHLALAGWLLGTLFVISLVFVGLPAAVLAC